MKPGGNTCPHMPTFISSGKKQLHEVDEEGRSNSCSGFSLHDLYGSKTPAGLGILLHRVRVYVLLSLASLPTDWSYRAQHHCWTSCPNSRTPVMKPNTAPHG